METLRDIAGWESSGAEGQGARVPQLNLHRQPEASVNRTGNSAEASAPDFDCIHNFIAIRDFRRALPWRLTFSAVNFYPNRSAAKRSLGDASVIDAPTSVICKIEAFYDIVISAQCSIPGMNF